MNGAARNVTVLPPLYELRGASRSQILGCLGLIEQLDRRGIRPPDGYLFGLSREVMRLQAEAQALAADRTSRADERKRQSRQVERAQAAILRDWWNCAQGRAWNHEDLADLEFLSCEEGVLVRARDGGGLHVLFQDGVEVCCIDDEALRG